MSDQAEYLDRWNSGDPAAAQWLFEQYARRLTALAEQQISRKLAARVGGEDIVQSVFRTFFQRSARGEFRIDSSADLWQLLVTITLAKVRSQARRHTAGRRDVKQEIRATDDRALLMQSMAAEPGPDEAAALVDQIEWLLHGLPESYSEVLALRLEGYSRTEIAARLNVSRQTVYRALVLLQERLERLLAE
jgi:RNA polymerase sigma-70 factor, ECF subfamily